MFFCWIINAAILLDTFVGFTCPKVFKKLLWLGDGAIIATGSILTSDVAPYSIVGGNPAKEIRKRFKDEVIAALLDICWWDWPLEKITEHVQDLTSNEIEKLKTIG